MPEQGRPSRATILIADDAVHIRRLCALMLESHDFHVLEVESGTEAVEMYGLHRPDLVLLDIGMPGGGVAALTAIKEINAAARVVMLTGQRDAQTVASVLALGVGDYVVKPFTRRRLLAAVERLLT
jgi:two-component system chemotaxis response regulator CheY